jgi:hypothetical protein
MDARSFLAIFEPKQVSKNQIKYYIIFEKLGIYE